ncbi:MAG: hypothetical protein WCA15_10350 [Candidatus Acidiferrales bacterium]
MRGQKLRIARMMQFVSVIFAMLTLAASTVQSQTTAPLESDGN